MSTAKVVDPDNIVCRLEFTMKLKEWKQIRKTLNTSAAYDELQIMNEIDELIRQLEKVYYDNVE